LEPTAGERTALFAHRQGPCKKAQFNLQKEGTPLISSSLFYKVSRSGGRLYCRNFLP
jgi:hypothetical protein